MPTLAPVRIIIAGIDNFSATYSKAFSKMEKAGKKISDVGKKMSVGLTLPIVGAGIAVIKTASDFEKSMNRVESVTFATSKEMDSLRATALKLGADTQFSASEAANAMFYLGQAGLKTNDILSVTPQVLNLAASSGIEMGRSAEIMVDNMNAMGLSVKDTGMIIDTFAAVANASTIGIEDISESMKHSAPIAKAYGASMNDLATVIGFLGNIGIKGEQSGTAIKNIFLSLAAPTKSATKWFKHLNVQTKDAAGNPVALAKVFTQLGNSLKNMPKAGRLQAINDIFGMIPIASAAALADDLGNVNSKFMKLTSEMSNINGVGQKMADILMKGTAGQLEQFKGSLETLAITIANTGLIQAFTELLKRGTEFANKISAINPNILKFGVVLAGVVAVMGPLLVITGTVIGAIGSIGTAIASAGGVIALLSNPIGWVVGAVLGLTATFIIFSKQVGQVADYIMSKWNKIVPIFRLLGQEIDFVFTSVFRVSIGETLDWLGGKINWIIDLFKNMWDIFKNIFDMSPIDSALKWLGKSLYDVKGEQAMINAGFTPEMVGKNYFNDNGLNQSNYESTLANIRKNKDGSKNELLVRFEGMPNGLKVVDKSRSGNIMMQGPSNYELAF
jgi:TP901 family phage tail tape measure protein